MEIKPCPFCGFDDPYYDEQNIPEKSRPLIFLVCPECECEGPTASDPNEAAEKWNKRAE